MKGLSLPTFADKRFWVAVTAFIISVVLEYYGRACGFILTSDSVQYLSSARSFQLEGKFLGDDGTYNPYWPPLFPILLSLSSKPLVLLGWINTICKALLAGVIVFLSRKFFKSDFYAAVFIISSMLSVYVMMISVFVWTELMFMTLIFLNVYFALNLNKRFYFTGLLLTGFLLCVQRNAGLFWIIGLSVGPGLNKDESIFSNLKRAVIFFLISTSGLWAWNIYNTFVIPADFIFYDRPYFEGFLSNTALMIATFARMFAPAPNFALQLLVFVSVISFVWYCSRPISKNLIMIAILSYAAGFSVLGRLDVYELDRYFSVIAPFVFLLVLTTAEKLSDGAVEWLRYCLLAGVILWMSYTSIRMIKNVEFWHRRSCFAESSR